MTAMVEQPRSGPNIARAAQTIDWTTAKAQLSAANSTDDADDLIDSLTEVAVAEDGGGVAVPFLKEAIHRAKSDLSLRSAALALAVVARAQDADAVNILLESYNQN